jgi:hypothetical protein
VTKCFYCEREATRLCDFVVKRHASAAVAARVPEAIVTCDRAICNEHARVVGHMCERSRRTTNNVSDTFDVCMGHWAARADWMGVRL